MDSYNTQTFFSGIDIYNGGSGEAEVLNFNPGLNEQLFFTPMVFLEELDPNAANITIDFIFQFSMSGFITFYTTGAVAKQEATSTIFVWTYPDGIIPYRMSDDISGIRINITSSNSNDTSANGNAYLLKSHMSSLSIADTKISATSGASVIEVAEINDFNATSDFYNNQFIQVIDLSDGTEAVRRITDQDGANITVESPFPFTPATHDTVRILKSRGDVGTVNGAQPMSTSDITAQTERDGGTLDRLDDLTKAGGDGDLAQVPKNTLDTVVVAWNPSALTLTFSQGLEFGLNALKDLSVEITDNSDGRKEVRGIRSSTAWAGGVITLTLDSAPTFTPQSGDLLKFLPDYNNTTSTIPPGLR